MRRHWGSVVPHISIMAEEDNKETEERLAEKQAKLAQRKQPSPNERRQQKVKTAAEKAKRIQDAREAASALAEQRAWRQAKGDRDEKTNISSRHRFICYRDARLYG